MAKQQKIKPNVFIKGLNLDSIESYQSKETYRFAKNARLTGYSQSTASDTFAQASAEGGMVGGLSPYPSDRIALNLNMLLTYSSNKEKSISNPLNWMDEYDYEDATEDFVGNLVAENTWYWLFNNPNQTFAEGTLRIEIRTVNGSGNQGDENIVQVSGDDYYLIETVITEEYFQQYYAGVTDPNEVIAGIINNDASHPFQVYVAHTGEPETWGTATDEVTWMAMNYVDPEDYISEMHISVVGAAVAYEQDPTEEGQVVYNVQDNYSFLDYKIDSFSSALPVTNLQILGQYSFSDHMILMGTTQVQSYTQEELTEEFSDVAIENLTTVISLLSGYDFVMKVKQEEDGQLYTFTEGIDFTSSTTALSALFYYFGDLGFSEKKKLKITGAEENNLTKRIYFTDGSFPLRTMNVQKPQSFYAQYSNNPEYFDLFFEAKFSPVEITDYMQGGMLKNKGHSFCYRYITGDGRVSQVSPMSNPCSIPGNAEGYQNNQGGFPNDSSGKAIEGRIDNLDDRYDKVEMIHTEYLGGVPDPFSTVFGTFNIQKESNNAFVKFKRTGAEPEVETLSLSDLTDSTISWDTCQALEVKDNRLFCGNLNNTTITIGTDFSLYSYNAHNRPHVETPGSNPHLYSDYYHDNLAMQEGWISQTQKGMYGYMADIYRYIKGPNPDVFDTDEEDWNMFNDGTTLGHVFHGGLSYKGYAIEQDLISQYNGIGYGGNANFTAEQQDASRSLIIHQLSNGIHPYINQYGAEASPSTLTGPGHSANGNTGVRTGILGAQSKHFSTPLPGTGVDGIPEDYEGVRVTFRILDEAPDHMSISGNDATLVLDSKSLLPVDSGNFTNSTYSNFNGKPMNYTNPVYNGHFVGYRRDEVYRFGLVFYDKKGTPMFVKRLGDIRFPNHSQQYYIPAYSTDHTSYSGTGIRFIKQRWPYYYQTSRSTLDEGMISHAENFAAVSGASGGVYWETFGEGGFTDGYDYFSWSNPYSPADLSPTVWGDLFGDAASGFTADDVGQAYTLQQTQLLLGPYDAGRIGVYNTDDGYGGTFYAENKSGLRGCVLYPYFEVKLSKETTSKIGGYSIVRVGRDENNKTILFTGVLDRANLYSDYTGDDENGANMDGQPLRNKLGINSFPLGTPRKQLSEVKETLGGADDEPSGGWGNLFGYVYEWEYGKDNGSGSVYTLDAPDVLVAEEGYQANPTDRFDIVESIFSYKDFDAVQDFDVGDNTYYAKSWMQWAMDRGGQTGINRDGSPAGGTGDDAQVGESGMFWGVIDSDTLKGGSYFEPVTGASGDAGNWEGYNWNYVSSNACGAALSGGQNFGLLCVTNLGIEEFNMGGG